MWVLTIFQNEEEYTDLLMNTVKSQSKIRSVKTPRLVNPFEDSREKVLQLWDQLDHHQQSDNLPSGYGFIPGEEGYGNYDSFEVLNVGSRKKEKPIILPATVWLPRCVIWVQSLEIMNCAHH